MKSLLSKIGMGALLFLSAGVPCEEVNAANVSNSVPCMVRMADDASLEAARNTALLLLENRTMEGLLPGCYAAEDRAAFRRAIETATTEAEIAEATKIYQASVQGVRLSNAEHEYWYYIVSGPSVNYCQNGVVYDLTTKGGEQLKWNDWSNDASCMWKFVGFGKGKVKIVNRKTGRYMKNPGTLSAKVTSEASLASGTAFTLESLGEQRAYLVRENSGKNPIHADKNGTMVAWRTVNIGSASIWHFDPVDEEDLGGNESDNDMWKLVWADEFDIDGPVNPDDWTFERGFVRNSEPQWYQPDNAMCKNGNLVITARRERVKNPNYEPGSSDWRKNREYAEYTSSSIITQHKHDLKYGRIEVRAKIPVSSGSWPAIWVKGYPEVNGSWPACGEVDILEFYQKSIFANVAWSDAKGGSQWRTVKTPFTHFTDKDKDWADKYHVWRMDWDSLSIRLFLDDELLNVTSQERTAQPVGDFCKSEYPFKNPMFLLLNLALRTPDGIDESEIPATYYVDYVRFYQRKNKPTAVDNVLAPDKTWLVNEPGAPYVDTNAFDGPVCVEVYDLSGRLVHSGVTSSEQTVYSLSGLRKGVYIVRAIDGHNCRNGKIAIN